MVKRELIALRKEKTILFAIMIQLFIASFSSVILTGIMFYYDPDSIAQNSQARLTVGVLGDDGGQFSTFLEESNVLAVRFDDPAVAENLFKARRLDAIAYVPEESDGTVDMKLILPDMDAQATIVMMLLKGPMENYENYLREKNGVQMKYRDVSGKPYTSYEFLYVVILPILMFLPAFIAGSMVIDSFSEEIESKTLDTLLSTPVSISMIAGAKIFAALIVSMLQCILWLMLLSLNGFKMLNMGPVLLLALSITCIIAFSAFFAVLAFRDRERSQFIYSLLILVFFSLTYLASPSPFALTARLATGDPYVSVISLLVYGLIALALILIMPAIVKRAFAR